MLHAGLLVPLGEASSRIAHATSDKAHMPRATHSQTGSKRTGSHQETRRCEREHDRHASTRRKVSKMRGESLKDERAMGTAAIAVLVAAEAAAKEAAACARVRPLSQFFHLRRRIPWNLEQPRALQTKTRGHKPNLKFPGH